MRALVVSIADPQSDTRTGVPYGVPLAVRLGCRLVTALPRYVGWVREIEPGQLGERCAAHS